MKTETKIKIVLYATFVAVSMILVPTRVSASECWEITGWYTTPNYNEGAYVVKIPCTETPDYTGWVEVIHYNYPILENIWVRINLDDPHMNGWRFEPLIFFQDYGADGIPLIQTDIITFDYDNYMDLIPYSPEQGVPGEGCRVRFRHRNTGKCIYTGTTNGAQARNSGCSYWPQVPDLVKQTFVLDAADNGTYRLRNEQTNQCLYTHDINGSPMYSWQCWDDPNMQIVLDKNGDYFRLRHLNSGNCTYGNTEQDGVVYSWDCWNDLNMNYYVDIVDCDDSPPGACCSPYGCFDNVTKSFCEFEKEGTWNPYACGCKKDPWLGCVFLACQEPHEEPYVSEQWTEWKDRDNPSGSGDWETLSSFPDVCDAPIDIECQTTAGLDWTATGEVVRCEPQVGLVCKNVDQSDSYCEDYKVRFLCPNTVTFP